ncbi:MAG: glycoside hydrolase family 140 protein [Bacteroidota bacterium]|nr:glycoside hydrolase family 140 protein [Bacteroidota bacterium]
MKRLQVLILLTLLISGISFAQQKPAALTNLKIAADHRHFVDANGKPFFWLGDTGWLLFVKTNREEAEKYLEDRRQKGFNVIQVMVVHSVKAGKDIYGDSALINHDLSKPRITPGNTFGKDKEYNFWDHVDYIVDLAAKKGIYMAMVPIWGTNVKSGWVSREQARAYATFLAERYKNRKNIIWVNGGDIKPNDSIETWRIIGNTLKEKDPNHLVTFHPFGRHTSSIWFHDEPWLDFNMFQSGHRDYAQDTEKGELHYGPDNWKFLAHDFALSPAKPSLDGEPSYEKIPHGLHDTTQAYWTDNDVRRYGYWSVLAGGAGFTYGHNSVMQFYKPTDHGSAYGAKNYWTEAINDPGGKQMTYLKKLFLSRPFIQLTPDQSIIADGSQGERYEYLTAAHGKKYVFIYNYTGRPFKVNMGKIAGAKVKASWYNPRDGKATLIGTFKNSGIAEFTPAGQKQDGNDWVLILDSI